MALIKQKVLLSGARAIIERLRRNGFEAWIVGGAARDLIMGREPADIDIATNAQPADIERLFEKTLAVGAAFGVMLVFIDNSQFEVATFRADGDYLDGRRPQNVRFATAQEDAQRRDFTINAFFYDPESGEILDNADGRCDLEARLIRSIGDPRRRFQEDHLRMLRAVRFARQLDFRIEERTAAAIRELAPLITRISAERIQDELTAIFTGPTAGKALRDLLDFGLLNEVLPEVAAMDGVAQPPEFHPEGDVFTHTCLMLDLLENPSPARAWGALLHDIGKPPCFSVSDRIRFNGHCEVGAKMAGQICRRLHFPNDLRERVVYLVAQHLRILDLPEMRPARQIRFLREDGFGDLLEILKYDSLASLGTLDKYEQIRRQYEAELAKGPALPPLLSGKDLIALGLTPGPAFKRILDEAALLQLEGALCTKDQALDWVKRHFRLNADD